MIDMTREAIERRHTAAYDVLNRMTGNYKEFVKDIILSGALTEIYDDEADDYYERTSCCPNCGKAMELPKCSCGCEKTSNGKWVMAHYQHIRICDCQAPLWEWLEFRAAEKGECK